MLVTISAVVKINVGQTEVHQRQSRQPGLKHVQNCIEKRRP